MPDAISDTTLVNTKPPANRSRHHSPTLTFQGVCLISTGDPAVVPVPSGIRFQPIDGREVAARLVELALGKPAGLVPDIAGPRVYEMKELVRSYLQAAHRHRLIMPVRLPGKAARAFRDGGNLAPDHAVGHLTWEDFLAERAELPSRL